MIFICLSGTLLYTMTATESVEIGKQVTGKGIRFNHFCSVLLCFLITPCQVSIVPKNPDLVYAAIQSCKVLYNTYEMPLTVFADNTLESICVFGTDIQSGYGQGMNFFV